MSAALSYDPGLSPKGTLKRSAGGRFALLCALSGRMSHRTPLLAEFNASLSARDYVRFPVAKALLCAPVVPQRCPVDGDVLFFFVSVPVCFVLTIRPLPI